MLKRTISIMMCMLLLLGTLVATVGCANDETAEGENDTVVTYAEGDEYTPPDVNYGGKDFNVFTWDGSTDWVLEFSSELSKIDASTYYHLATVEQELGINFTTTEQPGGYYQMSDFVQKLYVMSGDDGIDLVCQYSLCASVGTHEGIYTDLLKLDYINWDAKYWSQNLRQTNTINNKMYWCTGDMTASTIRNMYLIAYNFDMAADNQMGDLYEVVKEGKWTIEKLKTLTADIWDDENDNTIRDHGDMFGFVGGAYNAYDAFQYSCNLPCVVVNNMGELEINSDLNGERGVDITNEIKDLLHNSQGTYANTKDNKTWEKPIEEEKAVFALYHAESLISSLVKTDINYGILPMPKYDEAQENYHTALTMTYSMFSVPAVANDPNMSAAVLESMSHSGYVSLAPTVFEALQYRYSKRAEDTEMLTILRDGIIYEPGRIIETMDIFALVRRTVRDNAEITAYYAADRNKFETGLDEVNFMFS